MALIDQAELAADLTYQSQVRMAALDYATIAILKSPGAHNRADEKIWMLATATLADGCAANTVRFAYGIAAWPGFVFQPGAPPTAKDADVITTIAAAWPTLAGVTAADTQG